jgi:hypothetical protein
MSLQEKLCPSKPMFVYKTKIFFPPFYFHFPCYCFDFVIENGGCLKEGHKAADLGILVRRFSNENEGDRRLEQNKTFFFLPTFFESFVRLFRKVLREQF